MTCNLTESSHFLGLLLYKFWGFGSSWCLSQLELTKYHKLVCLNKTFIPGSSGSWEVQNQGASKLCLVRVHFLVLRGLSSHYIRVCEAALQIFSYKDTNLIHECSTLFT